MTYVKVIWLALLMAVAVIFAALALTATAFASPVRSVQCGSAQCSDGSNFPQCTGWNGVPAGTTYYPGDGTEWVCTWNQGWVRVN